jgi:type II secretory pathway component PulF
MISSAKHKHRFFSELAKLLAAGFDIRRAAKVLMDTKLPASQEALLMDLNRGLEAGQSIAGSLASNPHLTSEMEWHILSAGERGGDLAPAFQHLADYFEMLAEARRDFILGLTYPLVVLHLGILMAVVPRALLISSQSIAQILAELVVTLVLVYAVTSIIVVVVRGLLKAAPHNPSIDRAINRIPWIGNARRNLAMTRFCKVYHSCLLAGIPMNETVRFASEAAQSGLIREAGKRLHEATSAGTALGPVFMQEDAFPKAFARSYATGEEAGTLDRDLARWSQVFQNDAGAAAKTASRMIPKVLYFFILVFVAWKLIAFFTSYYANLLDLTE